MRKRITIADVAREAGVSTATVSYVLNKTPNQPISEETVQRVLAAAKKLDYHRNDAARALKSNKTNRIGISVQFSINKRCYAMTLQGALEALNENGKYACLDLGTHDAQNIPDCINFYLSGNVDGIILMGEGYDTLDSRIEDKIVSMNIPCVVHNMDAGRKISSVNADFFSGAYAMTQRLIQQGAKRIVYYRTAHTTRIDRERQQAINRAAYEAGIPSEILVAKHQSVQEVGADFPNTRAWQEGCQDMSDAIDSLRPDDGMLIGWCEHLDYVLSLKREYSQMPQIGVLSHVTDTLQSTPRVLYDYISAGEIGRECVRLLLEQMNGNRAPVQLQLHSKIF